MPLFKNKFLNSQVIELNNGDLYVNWISGNWLREFIKYNFPNRSKKIIFFGVDGKKHSVYLKGAKKIFFSGENLEENVKHNNIKNNYFDIRYYWFNIRKNIYKNYMIDEVDLSLGFGFKNSDKYLRFPLWIMYMFLPKSNYKDIKAKIEDINYTQYTDRHRNCVCINSHDLFGVRTKICDDLKNILDITYAGKWRNNTNDLWSKYNNNKIDYMKLFKFNICSENMDAKDYCTEKIFDAFKAGCVPIYAGSLNKPEPDIINYDRVIFWDLDGDNQEQIKFVDRLNKNDDLFYKFAKQPKLNDYAVEYVAESFELLRLKLKEILS